MSLSHWCYTLLIYKDTALTEELTKAHHDFFARKYKIDLWKSSQNNQHRDGATRESLNRIIRDDDILTVFRTHEWDIVNVIHLWKIKVALKSRLIWKCAKTVFLKSRLISRLTWNEGKIHELPQKSRLFSKCARIPLLYILFLLIFFLKVKFLRKRG